jgi:DNA-binding CsgD family transcriptional regulator
MAMAELSPRQREVLGLVAAGRTSKEIAGDLGISESTVNWHISNVFGRLGASSRAEAVALAMRDDAARPDAVESPHRPSWRPPVPLFSVALAVAVTLILGLIGGALLAGWQLPTSLSPSASAAPSLPDPRSPDPTAQGRSSVAPATGVPATPTAPPPPSPSIDQVAPVLPALPTVLPLPLPTALPLPLPTALPLPAGLPSLIGR